MNAAPDDSVIEALETELLVEAITRAYGVDFRRYSHSSLAAWTQQTAASAGASSIAALIERMLHDPEFGAQALGSLPDCDIELCANPPYWQRLGMQVLPWLRTHPFIDIWIARCGSGGSAYSLAIWLDEAGLLERAHIYATDSDTTLLNRAAQGVIGATALNRAERNYRLAGGKKSLRAYLEPNGGQARLHQRLRQNIVWSQFNLERGESFNEFNFIDCRTMPAGIAEPTRSRIFQLFDNSLSVSGLIALDAEQSAFDLQRMHCYKEWGAGFYQRVC